MADSFLDIFEKNLRTGAGRVARFGNSAILNQAPRLGAGAAAVGSELAQAVGLAEPRPVYDTYSTVLKQLSDQFDAAKRADPEDSILMDIAGAAASPIQLANAAKFPARLAGAGAEEFLRSYRGSDDTAPSAASDAAEMAVFQSVLEGIPLVGKAAGGIGDWLRKSSLGLKSTKKFEKTSGRGGLVKGAIERAEEVLKNPPPEVEDLASEIKKVFALGGTRAKSYEKLVDKIVDMQTAEQRKFVKDAIGDAEVPALDIRRTSIPKAKNLEKRDERIYKAAYERAWDNLIPAGQDAKNTALTAEDLIVARSKINKKYHRGDQATIEKQAYSDVADEISKQLRSVISARIGDDAAEAFSELGRAQQEGIAALGALKVAQAEDPARMGDLVRAGIGGSPIAIALGATTGIPWEVATAVGVAAGSQTGRGAIGSALSKLGSGTVTAGEVAVPALGAAARGAEALPAAPESARVAESVDDIFGVPEGQSYGSEDDDIFGLPPGQEMSSLAPTQTTQSAPRGPAPSANELLLGLKRDSFLDAVRQVESGGDDRAVSPAGAMGPYQFMPGTAKDLGLEDPFDEPSAREASARYFSQLGERYPGRPDLAVAAYNFGMGNVDKAIDKAGSSELPAIWGNLPKETQGYLNKVFSEYGRRLG